MDLGPIRSIVRRSAERARAPLLPCPPSLAGGRATCAAGRSGRLPLELARTRSSPRLSPPCAMDAGECSTSTKPPQPLAASPPSPSVWVRLGTAGQPPPPLLLHGFLHLHGFLILFFWVWLSHSWLLSSARRFCVPGGGGGRGRLRGLLPRRAAGLRRRWGGGRVVRDQAQCRGRVVRHDAEPQVLHPCLCGLRQCRFRVLADSLTLVPCRVRLRCFTACPCETSDKMSEKGNWRGLCVSSVHRLVSCYRNWW